MWVEYFGKLINLDRINRIARSEVDSTCLVFYYGHDVPERVCVKFTTSDEALAEYKKLVKVLTERSV